MKRKATLLTIALVCIIMAGNISASQFYRPVNTNEAILINYTWYSDEDMTDPTGTISDVATELNRLRSNYPSNVFSSVPGGNLYAFEWGYYQFSPVKIIYSDL